MSDFSKINVQCGNFCRKQVRDWSICVYRLSYRTSSIQTSAINSHWTALSNPFPPSLSSLAAIGRIILLLYLRGLLWHHDNVWSVVRIQKAIYNVKTLASRVRHAWVDLQCYSLANPSSPQGSRGPVLSSAAVYLTFFFGGGGSQASLKIW